MIDVNNFLADLWTPLNNIFDGDLQILLANQEIPDDQITDDRIVYNMISLPGVYSRQSVDQFDEVVASDDVNFEKDIMRTTVLYPNATISFNAFGADAINNLQQIREWFVIPNRGDIWLSDNWDCAIRNVTENQDRTTFLETDYETRYGFDIILNFKDVVEDRLDTIEKVEGTINGVPYEQEL